MKKLMIISTLSILSFGAIANDSCSMLSGQEQRLNSCQADMAKTDTDISNLQSGIDDVQRKLSPRAENRRAEELATCNTQNTNKDAKIAAIRATNKSAKDAISTVSGHKQDIANRTNGNRLIKAYECVTIDHHAGNSRVSAGWGGFAGQQAIFIGEGQTAALAQQAMIQDAAAKRYFTKDASDRRKRILKNMNCLPVFAVNKADRVLSAVDAIIAEANKVKMPTLANSGNSNTDSDRGSNRGRGNRRGNRRGN